jgi:hypothetical protein
MKVVYFSKTDYYTTLSGVGGSPTSEVSTVFMLVLMVVRNYKEYKAMH